MSFATRTLHVKPAKPDLIVRRPASPYNPLPAEGAEVPDEQYWRRRLACGDVVRVEPVKATTSKEGRK